MIAAVLIFCICGTVCLAMLAQAIVSVHEADAQAARQAERF
jgi:hypothetical protein